MRRIALSILIYVGLLILALGLYLGILILRDSSPLLAGDAAAAAEVWLDEDSDGVWDPGEPPLTDVCIWESNQALDISTAEIAEICAGSVRGVREDGHWEGSFRAGGSCDDIYIYARPPEGYAATRPPVARGCFAQFGFAPEAGVDPDDVHTWDATLDRLLRRQRRAATVRRFASLLAVGGLLAGAGVVTVLIMRRTRP